MSSSAEVTHCCAGTTVFVHHSAVSRAERRLACRRLGLRRAGERRSQEFKGTVSAGKLILG